MAEFEELIPALREVMTISEEVGYLERFKLGLNGAAGNAEGVFKTALEDISTKVEFIEGKGFVINDIEVIGELEVMLRTGDVTSLFEMAGTDLEKLEVQNAIRTFNRVNADLPERRLADLAKEQRLEVAPIESEAPNLDEISKNPSEIQKNQRILEESPKTASINKWFDNLLRTTKVLTFAGITVFLGITLAEFIKNYINAKSGAFEVTTTDGMIVEKKIAKYSCGFPGGEINHPFDTEITAYLKNKNPCLDVAKYDSCAGWATIGKGSRLATAGINVSKLGRNRTLICRKANAMEALGDLVKKAGHTISDIVKDVSDDILDIIAHSLRPFAPLIGVGVAIFTGGITFFVLAKQRMVIRIGASLLIGIILGVILYLIITHLRSTPVSRQSSTPKFLIPIHFTKIRDGVYIF